MKPLAQERSPAAESKDTRAHRIEAVVVSSDDGLLIELGPILGNRYRTHTVDTPAEIASNVGASRWLGIVDAASLADARGAIARMELQYHRCPLIVITPRPEEWSAAISRGAVAGAVARHEITGPRLAEALTVAENRLRADVNAENSAAAFDTGPAGTAKTGVTQRLPAWVWMSAVLIAVLAAGAWWLLRKPHSNTGAANTASGAISAVTDVAGSAGAPRPQTVLELLSAARVAFSDQKLLLPRADGEPHGDSALELYTQVLSQQPGNDEALDGVRRLFALGKARIQADLAGGKLDDASRLVGYFKAAGVNGDELHDIDASINAARPKWIANRAQQDIAAGDVAAADQLIGQLTASGANPSSIADLRRALDAKRLDTQLTAMANQVKAAISAGALLEPTDDNARTRFLAMRNLSRNHALTLAAQRELQAALLQRGGQATRAAQFDVAQRFVSAAAELGASPESTDAKQQLQNAIDAAAARASSTAAAAKARQAAAVAATAQADAATAAAATAAAATPRATVLPYIAARPRHALNVRYPDGVNIAGTVTVEFTLQPDGTATDPRIVQAQPLDLFDQAAMNAVSHGIYDTRELAGRAPPVRARILLRFNPS